MEKNQCNGCIQRGGVGKLLSLSAGYQEKEGERWRQVFVV